MIELAEGAPPSANGNPLQAIRASRTTSMMDFLDLCCKENPSERSDAKSLMGNAFVKSDVACDREGRPLFPWHFLRKES